jgi:hypothetical protein
MTILTDEKAALQDSDRQKIFSMIMPTAHRALYIWDKFPQWVRIKYLHQMYPASFVPVELSTIIREIEFSKTYHQFKGEYFVNSPDNLPLIKSNGHLPSAFTEVLFDTNLRLESGGQVTLEELDGDKIGVEITKQFKSPPFTPDYFQPLLSFSGYFSTFLLIIREHGSETQITPTDKSLIFKFTLPVWHENN